MITKKKHMKQERTEQHFLKDLASYTKQKHNVKVILFEKVIGFQYFIQICNLEKNYKELQQISSIMY